LQSLGFQRETINQESSNRSIGMKILLLTEIFPPKTGGSGRWFWEVYRRLPRNRVLIAAGEDARQEAFDRSHDLRLVRLPLTFPTWGLLSTQGVWHYGRAVQQLLRLVKRERIDAVHCGRCLPEGLIALLLRCLTGFPYLCYAHGEELNYAHFSREFRWLMRSVYRGARLVIANSRNTQRLLLSEWRLPSKRVRLLHPGVDTTRFVPAARDPGMRDRLGWQQRPIVLTVGRLQKRKGHDMLIRALHRVRRRIPNVLYAIAGEGEERPHLEQLVIEEGLSDHVQFLGEPSDQDLVRCYQQCDLFVLPNRQVGKDIEGFGMVLLEAQACGKPVLAGASGGTAETMRQKETGLVVSCDQPEPLADGVIEFLGAPDRLGQMGRAARSWVVERFDWASLTRRAEQLFRQGVDLPSNDHVELVGS
jgi:phosphatidylinositol alpha-1,6-mannosyltransferase